MVSVLLVSALASAQEAPPIVNGSTTRDYEPVGALMMCDNRNYCFDFCSASIFDTEWVVTAAHCVDAIDEYAGYGYDPYFVIGSDVSDGITDYDLIDFWEQHPDWNASNLQNDIGILHLQSGITSAGTVLLNTEAVDNSWLGFELRYVGFGITGDGRSDSGTKRYTDIPIYDYDRQFVVAYDESGRTNVCQGDSGGAGLYEDGSSIVLVAVNSYVTPRCNGGATGGARVDTYVSWLESYLGSDPGGGTSGGGTSGGGSSGGGTSGGGSGSGGASDGGDAGTGSDGSGSGDAGGGTDTADPGATLSIGESGSLDFKGSCNSAAGAMGGLGLAAFGLAARRRRR
jgi:hypothetical protein